MKKTEDRRIVRTKNSLIRTMRDMLSEMPFEKITVKGICERAGISRITFYNYYSDKYALLEELFRSMGSELEQQFNELQKKNVTDDPGVSYGNLLDCFFEHYVLNQKIFANVTLEQNTILVPPSYHFMVQCAQNLIEKYSPKLKPNYPPEKLAIFIVLGLFGYIHLGNGPQSDQEKINQSAHQLLDDLIQSGLFTLVDNKADD